MLLIILLFKVNYLFSNAPFEYKAQISGIMRSTLPLLSQNIKELKLLLKTVISKIDVWLLFAAFELFFIVRVTWKLKHNCSNIRLVNIRDEI